MLLPTAYHLPRRTWLSVFLKLLSSPKALLMVASYLSRIASSTLTYSTGSLV